MKSNLKLFLFSKSVSHQVNNIRVDYTDITQLKKTTVETEIKTRIPKPQWSKVKNKPDFVPFLLHTDNKEIGV